jgi:serine/threonine protein kinase/WD40 repeat protein
MHERSIFAAALDIEDPRARADYLDQHCNGDHALRQRIDRLLGASAAAGGILDKPVLPSPPTEIFSPIEERPGTQIGPYKLMEQIGEGGFGLVFVAEQQEPVRRKVALKVIKPGMDTREVVARFEAERQALAMMDHPHIAKVLDAGTTASGRPFFVMELVRGVPITEYCDAHQLTARQRLALFNDVCHAVQHAHQKGIIHRDLKPSNILVAPHDGIPVVKVIDFGISKALGQQLTEKTIYTRFAQMIGTPLYMSPEQAEINALDVDTRSDVYALGVLLYELLTGTTPFDKERLGKAAFDEIRRIIREEEPPKPSTRVHTLGASAASVSAQRKTEPTKLRQLLKNELDWIVMKALEKDRTRRYETANGLARDVQRYLADQPVEACPPSTLYRASKFVRRNKLAFTTGSLIAASVLVGLVTSTILAIQWHKQWTLSQEHLASSQAHELAANASAKLAGDREQIAIDARIEAVEAKKSAEETAKELEIAKEIAEGERDKAQKLADDLKESQEEQRRLYYAAQMSLLQQAWDTDNIARARQLLQATRPAAGEADLRGFEWHYWQRKVYGDTKTIQLQEFPGFGAREQPSAVLSLDGARAAVLAPERDSVHLHVWDTQSGVKVFDLRLPKGTRTVYQSFGIGICQLTSDRLALVRFPEYDKQTPVADKGYRSMAAELTVYDLAAKKSIYTLNAFTQHATAIPFVFSHDGSRVAALEWPPGVYANEAPPELQIWDGANGKLLNEFTPPPNSRLPLALNHDGSRLAVATYEGVEPDSREYSIQLLDLSSNPPPAPQAIRLPKGNRSWALEFSPRGDRLGAIISSSDGDLTRVYELPSGAEMCAIEAGSRHHIQKGLVSYGLLRFSPEGHAVALRYLIDEATRGIRLYRAETGERLDDLKGYTNFTHAVAMRYDPQEIVCLDGAGEIRIWPAPRRSAPPGIRDAIRAVTADDRFQITAQSTGQRGLDNYPRSLRVADRHPPFARHSIELAGHLLKLRLSPDGRTLAAFSASIESESEALILEVFEVATGTRELVQCWPARGAVREDDVNGSYSVPSTSLAFSPDSQRLVYSVETDRTSFGGATATLAAWDLARGEQIFAAPVRAWQPWSQSRLHSHVTFSPDGKQLLCQLGGSSFELRNAVTGELISRDITGRWVTFAAGGSLIAYVRSQRSSSSAISRICCVDNSDTGVNLAQFAIRDGVTPTAVAVSPEVSSVAIAHGSNVLLIDVKTGQERFILPGHRGSATSLAFSPDGRRLAVSSREASTPTQQNSPLESKLWDTQTGQQLLTLAGGGVLRFDSATLYANRADDLVHVPTSILVANEHRWDASPPPPEIEARRAIESLTNLDAEGRVVTRAQWRQQIAADRFLSPTARQRVEEHIRTYERDIINLAKEEILLLLSPDHGVEAYQRLLDIADEALEHPAPFLPRKISELHGLEVRGHALYRLARYYDAMDSLERAETLRMTIKDKTGPFFVAFRAMAQHRTGNIEKARQLLAEAKDLAKHSESPEACATLLAEAEALLGGKSLDHNR